jgi:DNA-binding response OmpR family regulator
MAGHPEESAKRVLILDEEPFVRDTLKLNLAGYGFGAEFAEDEEEARRALLGPSPPACVILEILHSRLDAYRFLQWMRSQPRLARLPVIILTFKEKDPETAFTYNAWTQGYLTKPFVPQEVMARVAESVAWAEASGRPEEERF